MSQFCAAVMERVQILLCVSVLLQSAAHTRTAEPSYDITDPAFIQECVREHNAHRSGVTPAASNMRYMTWDGALAITAQAWARKCVFKHNIYLQQPGKTHPTFTPVGENIWAGTSFSQFSVKSVVKSWANEVQHYDYETNQCSGVCGHYTQVVWADSYKVGCAAHACHNGVAETSFSSVPGLIFVCNYATAGNYRGVAPYKTGTPCSACRGETCKNNLCRNSTRDADIRYNWRPDWDPTLSSCGSFCKSLLVIRPVSVGITFISVFCLQHHYTNLFAYE